MRVGVPHEYNGRAANGVRKGGENMNVVITKVEAFEGKTGKKWVKVSYLATDGSVGFFLRPDEGALPVAVEAQWERMVNAELVVAPSAGGVRVVGVTQE